MMKTPKAHDLDGKSLQPCRSRLSFTERLLRSAVAQEQVTQIMAVNAKGLTQCRSMTDSLERLVCYDQLADSLSNAQPVRPLAKQPSRPEPTIVAPDVDAPYRSTASRRARDTFGRHRVFPQLSSLVSTAKTSTNWCRPFFAGKRRLVDGAHFCLRNGQIWQQSDNRKLFKPNDFTPGSANAAVSKASLGSFLLRVNDRGTAIRVKYVE